MSMINEYGLTPQQENFAQKVVSGETLSDAYRASYKTGRMTAKTIHEAASRVAADSKVAARLRMMQAAAAEIATLKAGDTLREVKALALADVGGVMNEDGSFRRLHELPTELRRAVAYFDIDKDGVIKYRFWSKLDALEKAMKHLGLYEQDNRQKADPLRELLDSLGGAVVGVSSGKSRRARER
ncbi:terminase small subunit [Accumulibacter sp.]|uniref:terminase small subunit n=1 Tax=Accumulibacter sp. TaxID=2053492 RepID=UPI001AC3ED82|nr:terminase small subunit [Accumulibacter sp.]MBN8514514.1 terminase small subunit [Accumulibacter sp.]MBO3702446.1 terminase small subunit [Accumulibacter sp.]